MNKIRSIIHAVLNGLCIFGVLILAPYTNDSVLAIAAITLIIVFVYMNGYIAGS